MNEDQARAILKKVEQAWGLPIDVLVAAPDELLEDELKERPVDDVYFTDLYQALRYRARDPRWAE